MSDKSQISLKEISIILLQIILSATFIFSAYTKIIAPGLIEIILIDHGIAGDRILAGYLTRILISFEFAIGILFLIPAAVKRISIPAALLFTVGFTLYLIYTGFILGDSSNCGCFGELLKMSPAESIIKNLIIILLLGVLFKLAGNKKNNLYVPAAVLVASLGLVFGLAPIRNVDEFMFREYTSFTNYGRVDLSEGEKLIALFDPDCEHCQETAVELNKQLSEGRNIPKLFILFMSESSSTPKKFFEKTDTEFPYKEIPISTFFDLIGSSPPRIYWLSGGKIKETWDDSISTRLQNNF
jgi:hypothetical protein